MPFPSGDRRKTLLKRGAALTVVLVVCVAGAAVVARKRTVPATVAAPTMAKSTALSVPDAGDAGGRDASGAADAGEACRELEAKYPDSHAEEGATGECKMMYSRTSSDCRSDSRGAWRLFVQSISVDEEAFKKEGVNCNFASISSTIALLRKTGDQEASETFTLEEGDMQGGDFEIVSAFDYDGDGIDEVVLKVTSWEKEGCGEHRYEVFTARDGTVSPYKAAPKEIAGVEDVDEDGRPDLLVTAYEETHTHCISGEQCKAGGISLVAHSVPNGTFATKDSAAIAYAKKQCPKPTKIDSQYAIACARMWGMSAEKTLAKAHCKDFGDPEPCGGQGPEVSPDACPSIFNGWANQEPPILLR